MDLIRKYFPGLSQHQQSAFGDLLDLLPRLNQQVNVISRKDIPHLEERHILHSLSIAKAFEFPAEADILDAGTGGGFPGIPLAILFPHCSFTLVDSIGKKIRLVEALISHLKLENVRTLHSRMEQVDFRFDFVVSRAVASLAKLNGWVHPLFRPLEEEDPSERGLIALKGGDLDQELLPFRDRVELFYLNRWFEEAFFSTKMIVYLKF